MARITLLAALVLVLAACGGDDEEESAATTAAATTAAETAADTGPASAAGADCRDVDQPQARTGGSEKQPSTLLEGGKTYSVLVKTSCGDFTITLDPKASPKAVASFVALARNDYFDDTFFHRIVPDFVIQGGDPTGTGGGGPGYLTVDPPAASTAYTQGVVAMAKTAADPPGTAGSQFFIVTATQAPLPPDYAVVGRVTGGEDVVAAIGELGDPTTEMPTQAVVIEDMIVQVG
jgi:cyclophilin family peptidyl-prolyl cis-trans isomerase